MIEKKKIIHDEGHEQEHDLDNLTGFIIVRGLDNANIENRMRTTGISVEISMGYFTFLLTCWWGTEVSI